MNITYKKLFDAWYDTQAVSAIMRFEGSQWNELIGWCHQNSEEFFSSVLEQLKEGPTWACQVIETVIERSPVKSDEWLPLDMWCSLWIYIIEGTIDEMKKNGSMPSYYKEGVEYKITKN